MHAHGLPRAIEDLDWLLQHVTQLTGVQESEQALPWKVSDAPSDFVDKMLNSIVGIEMPVTKLVGKWKVSQNRPNPDKLGTVAGLMAREDDDSKAIAALVNQRVTL